MGNVPKVPQQQATRRKPKFFRPGRDLASSPFNYKASEDKESLEFQAWEEGRWANRRGRRSTGQRARGRSGAGRGELPAEEDPGWWCDG